MPRHVRGFFIFKRDPYRPPREKRLQFSRPCATNRSITDLSKSINNVVDCEVDNDINFEEIDKLSFKIENDFVELKKIMQNNLNLLDSFLNM